MGFKMIQISVDIGKELGILWASRLNFAPPVASYQLQNLDLIFQF